MAAGDVNSKLTRPRAFRCYETNGSNFRISLGLTASQFNNSEPFSISCWVKTDLAGEANTRSILGKGNTAGDVRSFALFKAVNGRLTFGISKLGTGTSVVNSNTVATSIEDNNWHHCVGVWDGSVIRAYTDSEGSSDSAAVPTVHNTDNNFQIGQSIGFATSGYWQKQIADVRLFENALTQAEITTLYAGGKVTRGLKYTWNFKNNNYVDETSNITATANGGRISITEDQVADAVQAQRVGSGDKWLCYGTKRGMIGTIQIEA